MSLNARDVTDATFERDVLRATGITLVIVESPDCAPCCVVRRWVRSQMTDDDVRLVRLDLARCRSLPRRLGITVVPTLLAFVDGRERGRLRGAQSADELRRWLHGITGSGDTVRSSAHHEDAARRTAGR